MAADEAKDSEGLEWKNWNFIHDKVVTSQDRKLTIMFYYDHATAILLCVHRMGMGSGISIPTVYIRPGKLDLLSRISHLLNLCVSG